MPSGEFAAVGGILAGAITVFQMVIESFAVGNS